MTLTGKKMDDQENRKLRSGVYSEYFSAKFKDFNIPCVIHAHEVYNRKNKLKVRMYCKFPDCRQYNLFHEKREISHLFKIFHDSK